MSPNTHSSEYKASTSIPSNMLDNNSSNSNNSNNINLKNYSSKRIIIITKHLIEPCPIHYVDYFKSVNIVCKDPSHIHEKGNLENKIVKRLTDSVMNHGNDVALASSDSFKR